MKEWKEAIATKEFNESDLKKHLAEACKDDGFRNFVSSLESDDDTLSRYTSLLEDAYVEKKHCDNCPGLAACKNKVEGYRNTPKKERKTIDFSYVACKYEAKKERETAYQDYLYLVEVPKEMKEANLKEIYLDDKKRLPVMNFFKDFLKDYEKGKAEKGLYLYGSFGSGKTYLIAALFNEFAHRQVASAIIYFPEFLRDLKASFQEFDAKFEKVKRSPLLLIDDIGAENMTAWARDEVLGPILQYRMQEHLPTFFTSNFDLTQLEAHLSMTSSGVEKVKARRIIERIKQLTVSQDLISENRRK